eukprot:7321835-Prymnesium_polylepis.1
MAHTRESDPKRQRNGQPFVSSDANDAKPPTESSPPPPAVHRLRIAMRCTLLAKTRIVTLLPGAPTTGALPGSGQRRHGGGAQHERIEAARARRARRSHCGNTVTASQRGDCSQTVPCRLFTITDGSLEFRQIDACSPHAEGTVSGQAGAYPLAAS